MQEIIQKLNSLYITYRGKYLIQYPKGKYVTADTKKPKYKPLCDGFLNNHFKGTHTYGVFAGRVGTKFMTFDVDMNNEDGTPKDKTRGGSKVWTFKLVQTLIDEFQVPQENIHVSISGEKGYHVDLFFDFIQNKHIKVFYDKVIQFLEVTEKEIELKPTHSEGAKLPLGVHQKTGKRCWFVDTITLEPIKRYDHILNIESMPMEQFMNVVYGEHGIYIANDEIEKEKTLSSKQKKKLEHVASATDTDGKTVEECYDYAEEILELGHLKRPNTRHKTTLLLARYFNSIGGVDKSLAKQAITNIICRTDENYFSAGTTVEWRIKEVERLVDLAYERNYTIEGQKQQIEVSKTELLKVLEVKTLKQKQILFSMLVHSKRLCKKDGSFYMTYETLSKMTKMSEINRRNLKKHIDVLAEKGFVEVVSRDKMDYKMTEILGRPWKKPNVYRVLINEVEDDVTFIINTQNDTDLLEVIKDNRERIELSEIKKRVSKSQLYDKFRPLFIEVS